ncbi:N-acetylglucosamine-6-phosphate deacetylase [Rhizohabitans arisaemae]|uniref:N-acetylglucosamine-6-phosphate deacetylase n=1 Tax=Rhizohabitans arisaemae TaxID=2720610 RepID=UPI0024B12B5D|nr:N-acetylglucosamine-6-phosphate deacetylase [Rhizohabitans arisaemae]
MRISASGAVISGAWVAGDLEIHDGRVVRCGLPATGKGVVLPGLIDAHVCGYAGADFNTADAEGIAIARAALLRDGVFAFQPTVITDDVDVMVRQFRRIADAPGEAHGLSGILGVHAEGPFLSPDHRGVHRPEFLRKPDIDIVTRLREAGPLTTLTIAPELDGALPLISWAARQGIAVHLGHTGADAATAREAFARGARGVTHLFNGMAPFHHREPNVAAVALARSGITIQLIADDVHVATEVAETALRAAADRIVLVTDSTSAAGGADGPLTIAGLSVMVVDGVPRLADGTLAGSTVTLFEQVARLVRRGWAPDTAVNLASRAPARTLTRAGSGELQLGGLADLLVTTDDFRLDRVLQAGVDVKR